MATIRLAGIEKRFGTLAAVQAFDLDIADGEFIALVGPSGCGKTTTLRMLAGLETPSAGSICLGDQDITQLPAKARDLAMVFQNYALYPHMTVAQNIGYALKMRKMPTADIAREVAAAAALLDIQPLLDRKPQQLSGGQRQRVAVCRAIVRHPAAFLFDEPLSNLDAKLRAAARAEIRGLQQRLGITAVYVTHDQVEAMTMADRIVVMKDELRGRGAGAGKRRWRRDGGRGASACSVQRAARCGREHRRGAGTCTRGARRQSLAREWARSSR